MSGIFENLGHRLILASSSPRRRELLSHLGYPFSVEVPDIEERRRDGEAAEAYVQRNAREKALAVLAKHPPAEASLVIAADTIGVVDDHILEKPLDPEDAKRMLASMSGRSHDVLTGLVVASGSPKSAHVAEIVVRTSVFFKNLSSREIDFYVGTGEPLDKAGAYGIQGIGGFMVEKIQGSYSNVVGLPLVELIDLLASFTPSPPKS